VIKDPAYPDSSFLMNSPSSGCSLFISPDSGEVPILNLVGEVDLGTAPKIYSLLWQTSEQGRRSLILNLEKLEFMDSSGLQILLRLREKLRAKKQNVLVVGPRPQIMKLFKLTGLDQLFELVENNQEAKTIHDEWRQA
jgi:anti-sigma B factor antagonist